MTFIPLSVVVRLPDIKKYLNRDGLEEYNSLLPHSSGEMQDYVDDWLDAHPEATTTVQDGAISEPKLADKSVSVNKLNTDVLNMFKSVMLTRIINGPIIYSADSFNAPIIESTIYGKSQQLGNPTPDSPIDITSIEVESINLNLSSKNLFNINAVDPTICTVNDTTISVIDGASIPNYMDLYSAVSMTPNRICTDEQISKMLFLPSGTYTITCTVSRDLYLLTVDPITKTIISDVAFWVTASPVNRTFTLPQDRYVLLGPRKGTNITNIQIEIGGSATPYIPYNVTLFANVPTNGHVMRSLPDGTADEMQLTWLRNSEREGYAWYARFLVQNVGMFGLVGEDIGGKTNGRFYFRSDSIKRLTRYSLMCNSLTCYPSHTSIGGNSSNFVEGASAFADATGYEGQNWIYIAVRECLNYTIPEMQTWIDEHNIIVQYPLAIPIISVLNAVELPILPTPKFTILSNPNTNLQLKYIRDSNIVIQNIEDAIADL